MANRDTQNLLQKIEAYENLLAIIRSISALLEVDEVLQQIIAGAVKLCGAAQGSIMLFDAAGSQEMCKTLVRQGEKEGELLDHYLNTLLSGWMLAKKSPQVTDDLTATFGAKQIKAKYRTITSTLSSPLVWRNETIGCINLLALDPKRKFGERDISLIQVLAGQCAQFIINARLHESVFAEARRLRSQIPLNDAFHGIVGRSSAMRQVFDLLQRILPTDARVLIEGESGTGKERIAWVLHFNGPRKERPFIAIDCGAMPANLLESELFGHVKGAFTGAVQDKKGLFEEADGGTLFLDEIANMPLEIQAKFLRAIQESEIRPVGSTQIRKIDVRIIAAASSNLREKIQTGEFRQDLFYRLNIVNVQLPALRDRREDIILLADHFLKRLSAKYGKTLAGFRPETAACLEAYAWPGNVRELENVIERMVILAPWDKKHSTGLAEPQADFLAPDLLPPELLTGDSLPLQVPKSAGAVKDKKDAYEKQLLLETLARNNWNQSAAARELGVDEKSVRYKMRKFGIRKSVL